MQNEKIIQAIADWIEENEGDLTACALPSEHKDEIAELIFAAAIAPHLEAGAGWEDAPSWAEWRTVDKNRQVTFWEKQPHAHLLSKYWCDDAGGNRKYCEVDGWQYKIQQRPK